MSVREGTIREPEMVVEHVPLLNGGPPTSREEHRTTIISTVATTTLQLPLQLFPENLYHCLLRLKSVPQAWKKEYL